MTISVVFKGRLGNQLFQYATLRTLAELKKIPIYYNLNFTWHEQICKLNYFNLKESETNFSQNYKYNQPNNSFYFDKNIININNNTLIEGHFINEKYFDCCYSILKKELTIKDEKIIDNCEKFLKNIKNNNKIVGIHFRRGDDLSQTLDVENFNNEQIDFTKKALEEIKKENNNVTLLLFTGGFRNSNQENWKHNTHNDDLNWLKKFKEKNKEFNMIISPGSETNNELIDFYLLTKCDINILPNPSTFSWMASYLNDNNKTYYNKKLNNFPASKKFILI